MKLEPDSPRDAFIPESAPFTKDQRAWLNGFVAGLFAGFAQAGMGKPPPAETATAKSSLVIFYGSQTGTTEQLAKTLAKEAGQNGFEPRVMDMSGFGKVDLRNEKQLLILTSTWGDGDPPDNAVEFWNYLNSEHAPKLEQLEFSVLALGDRNYANFCGAGKKFDARLEQLGAKRIHPCAECDVDYEAPAQAWMKAIWPALKGSSGVEIKTAGDALAASVAEPAPVGHSKTNPFPARLLLNRQLNGAGSAKETRHFEISLHGSGLAYEVGDALGVLPANCPVLVEEMMAALGCDGEETVKLANGWEVSFCTALREHLQITRVPQSLLAAFAERSKDAALSGLLQPANKSELDKFLYGREIIHLLHSHPHVRFVPSEFVGLLPRLQPRLYSISSSPKAHLDEVHLTVAVVRYDSHGRNCKGVCSTFLAERVSDTTPVPVFIQTSHGFRLPQDTDRPVIMIGPGTGVAPFRAFLEERQAVGAKGKNWLFFGDQRSATDFLYRDELAAMRTAGHLTRLDTAFSRDQAEKIHVQQRLLENATELWAWLDAGAHVYVCGDAKRMAKDVDAALHQLIQTAGGKTNDQALAYVQNLKQEKKIPTRRLLMNTPAIPFEEIKGQKLSDEQRAYLEGLFAGLANRGFKFSDVETNPAAAPSHTALDENLIFEERVKRELHPLDAYPLLLENAAANRAPERENIFRFKWNGLFYLSPNKEAFMARLRIPAGQLKTFQWREIARVAAELTSGYVQITTRANLQIRLIQVKDAPEVLSRIQSVGLHTRGAGADNIRDLTANPAAGIDPHELIDTAPLCHQLGQLIINDRRFYDLPRKFNVAFDGGGLTGTVEDTNDIGIKAVRVETGNEQIKPGIYFRVKLGGATGHKTFARDLGVLVRPDEILKVTMALIRVFIANGNRSDRKKARLKHLLEKWTLEQYLAETEKLLGYQLPRSPLDDSGRSPLETPQALPPVPHSHVGVFPQKQAGFNYLGVAIPVGQITTKQMLRLADLVDNYASGEIRLTVWQNLLIPNVRDGYVETLKKALVKMGLHWQQSNVRSGVVACTGNAYCKFAATNTKTHALALADHLEKRFKLDQPINLHLTGCPNSCAQHYMGDIGLLGTKIKSPTDTDEGYHVFVGGGFGENQAVGRQIFSSIPYSQLKSTLEKMLEGYLRRRQPGENFQKFSARHDLNTLQAIFTNDE